MARGLSLSAYLAFARRQPAKGTPYSVDRPIGGLIWLHCTDPARAAALAQIGLRLSAQRESLSILVTWPPDHKAPKTLPIGVVAQPAPSEHPSDVSAFLDHWKPDAALWLGAALRPALVDAAANQGVELFLLDAGEPSVDHRRWRLVPEPLRATMRRFSAIFATSPESAARIQRYLPDTIPVVESGPLLDDSAPMVCNEDDLSELALQLAGRPVWLAAHVQPEEIAPVLAAQRSILRLVHKSLLVLVPDGDPAQTEAVLAREGWRVADWDEGEFPDSHTQVVLSRDLGELGLWYRTAPVSFVGSSLVTGYGGRDPLEPAALGSAVIYGPAVQDFLASYSRLARAGAAVCVRDADSLTSALGQLTAPDEVAQMAHAGWEAVSEGAEVTDQIIEMVHEALDKKE